MSTFLTMDEIDNAISPNTEQKPVGFIKEKGPDPRAAAERFYVMDDLLKKWHNEVNKDSCNTRSMPKDLVEMYDKACDLLIQILRYEKSLM